MKLAIGIHIYLKQISSPLLNELLADPALVRVVVDAEPYRADKFINLENVEDVMRSSQGATEEMIEVMKNFLISRQEARARMLQLKSYAEGNVAALDMHKYWHGVHFLLTGEPWGGEPPLFNAIMGGTEICKNEGTQWGYGPPRYLTPDEVKEVTEALRSVSREDLKKRFDPSRMSEAEIYAFNPDEETKEVLECLLSYCDYLSDYYSQAASRNYAMLIYAI